MNKKICCIFNLAPRYNAPIFNLMDQEIGCDFYFGDKLPLPILRMNYDELDGFKKTLRNIFFLGNFYWQKGALKLIFKPYNSYILTGEPYNITTWLIMILAKIMKKETILWSHGYYGDETFLKRKVKKIFFNLSTSVLLYGNRAKNIMISEGIRENKLFVIYNSLDYEKQLKVRAKLKPSNIFKNHFLNDFPTIIYVGRIQKNKKVELLINAADNLIQNGESCNLVIIGDEVESLNLYDKIEKKGLIKNIWLFGPCYDEISLGELIYNSNICVVPGDVGLSIMHSFVYGIPVITHNNFPSHGPEFEAIDPGVTGDFFVENSIEDLCNKISDWISITPQKKNQTKEECHRVIEKRYNPKVQVNLLKRILK